MFLYSMWGIFIIISSWSDVNFSILNILHISGLVNHFYQLWGGGRKTRRPLLISSKLNGSFMEFSFNLYDQILLSRTRLRG